MIRPRTPIGPALLLAACAGALPRPALPLCDHHGAPACGNVGQAGRPERTTPPAPAITQPVTAAAVERVVAPLRRGILLLTTGGGGRGLTAASPLMLHTGEPAPGNVPSKRPPNQGELAEMRRAMQDADTLELREAAAAAAVQEERVAAEHDQ